MQATLFLIAGLALLVFGGDLLVRGAVRLAERMGVSAAMVGTVIVGSGTSMPELAASLDAALGGSPGIAWGNVIGSNIANTLLILGVAALVWPISTKSFSAWRDPLIGLGATALLAVMVMANFQGTPAAILMLGGIVAYVWWCYRMERDDAPAAQTSGPHIRAEALEGADHSLHAPRNGYGKPVALLLAGLLLLLGGARLLVTGAVDLAQWFGLSEAVIGLTIVAIGTSLPELVTSVIAAVKRESGIALGNVIGSNIFNILAIGGATLLVAPHSIPAQFAGFELPLLLGLAAILMLGVLARVTIGRVAGMMLVAGYIAFTAWSVGGV